MSRSDSAKIYVDTKRIISQISPLLFSGFAEHMGRCIYEGIYEPSSPQADENGLRKDVLAALRELNYRSMRYPGGNFLSGYRWEDGIGPKRSARAVATSPGSRSRPINSAPTSSCTFAAKSIPNP